jgi:hypothetical protein
MHLRDILAMMFMHRHAGAGFSVPKMSGLFCPHGRRADDMDAGFFSVVTAGVSL